MTAVDFDGLVCDLDGVIYRGDHAIAGAADAVAALRAKDVRIVFCTNNSRSTAAQYVTKLAAMGIPCEESMILTSGVVTAEVLSQRGSGQTAMVVGGDGIREPLTSGGVSVVEPESGDEVDFVVVGLDLDFSYERMKAAGAAVRAGASLVATNHDATFPAADGLWPGAGAILASIEATSGARAEVMGKPHQPMMEAAARRLSGCRRIAIVGDRPDTDLAGGAARAWTTILVTSGVTAPSEVDAVRPVPDYVFPSIAALV